MPVLFVIAPSSQELEPPAIPARFTQFVDGQDDWTSRAILRSLKMATSALRLSSPTGATESFYDYGRILSLWVSAFEILVHPGAMGKATRQNVLDLLSTISWQNKMMQEATHKADLGGGKVFEFRLANALYVKMNGLRNDYLHGNPVEPEKLHLDNGTWILSYPAAIFRMALSTMLSDPDEVTPEQVRTREKTLDDYGRHIRATSYRIDCEECLLTAVKPQPADDE